jgi:uncharacterized integral membrane protein
MPGDDPDHEPAGAPSVGSGAPTPPTSAEGSEPGRSLAEVTKARRRRAAKAIVALVIFVLLVLFVVANAQPVEVNFLVGTFHPRLIWVMVTCAVLGGVLGYLLGRPGHEAGPKKKGSADPPRG